MNKVIREQIKQNLKKSLFKYLSKRKYHSSHPLDLLIPKERKVRSVVGGLETSMGTTVWEPIARTLAEMNGFEIATKKILRPKPFPKELAQELSTLITLRESLNSWITAKECVIRIKSICMKIDRNSVEYVKPSAGTGVDILLLKNGKEYAFDIKTVKPNLSSIKGFNKQILEWYAYRICEDPEIDLKCSIAYPYNPYEDNFWKHTPNDRGILQPKVDALVENEFWDFISGQNNTFQEVTGILSELNKEGFGRQLSVLIDRV